MSSSLVADASFVVNAWLPGDDQGRRAHDFLESHHVFVPELLFVEVSKQFRRFENIGWPDAEREFSRFLSAPWFVIPFAVYGRLAWTFRHDVSLTDACYVALARGLRVPLVTHDLKLAKTAARYCDVMTPNF